MSVYVDEHGNDRPPIEVYINGVRIDDVVDVAIKEIIKKANNSKTYVYPTRIINIETEVNNEV